MNAADVLQQLNDLGSANVAKVLRKHGANDPLLGVKIGDLKKILRHTRGDHPLAMELFQTRIYDAQYLAGLIADGPRMTENDLRNWLDQANCHLIRIYSVAWVAAESEHGQRLGTEWIEADDESVAATGWSTLASLVSIRDDAELDLPAYEKLFTSIGGTIHDQPAHVAAAMNNFMIAVGSYVRPLTEVACETARRVGPVKAETGDTDCAVPDAEAYIRKVESRGTIGKKRKSAKC